MGHSLPLWPTCKRMCGGPTRSLTCAGQCMGVVTQGMLPWVSLLLEKKGCIQTQACSHPWVGKHHMSLHGVKCDQCRNQRALGKKVCMRLPFLFSLELYCDCFKSLHYTQDPESKWARFCFLLVFFSCKWDGVCAIEAFEVNQTVYKRMAQISLQQAILFFFCCSFTFSRKDADLISALMNPE